MLLFGVMAGWWYRADQQRRRIRAALAGEVVHGLTAYGLGVEVCLHPRGDLRGIARAAAEAVGVRADEVVDVVVGDVPLELGERRRRVGAVEPADRHDRLSAGQLQRCRAVRADRGRRPPVAGRAVLEQRGEGAAELRVAGQAAAPAACTTATDAAVGAATESAGEAASAGPSAWRARGSAQPGAGSRGALTGGAAGPKAATAEPAVPG